MTRAQMTPALISGIFFVLLASPVKAQSPSFDCRRASTPTEFAICDDAGLSRLDVQMVNGFRAALNNTRSSAALRSDQALWRRWRNTCGGDRACLTRRYQARIIDLSPRRAEGVIPMPDDILEQIAAGTTTSETAKPRLRNGRYERVNPDGSVRWVTVDGGSMGTDFPDGSTVTSQFIQVGNDDFPTLPPDATPWVSELESSLKLVVLGLLPATDHAAYDALQVNVPLEERMFRHVDAIQFLSFR